ncbi:MAG: hypothetical protein NVSMB46_00160 [Candidatus Saccharimonadales bacterium]
MEIRTVSENIEVPSRALVIIQTIHSEITFYQSEVSDQYKIVEVDEQLAEGPPVYVYGEDINDRSIQKSVIVQEGRLWISDATQPIERRILLGLVRSYKIKK